MYWDRKPGEERDASGWETIQVTCERSKRRTKKEGHHGNKGTVLWGRSGGPPWSGASEESATQHSVIKGGHEGPQDSCDRVDNLETRLY